MVRDKAALGNVFLMMDTLSHFTKIVFRTMTLEPTRLNIIVLFIYMTNEMGKRGKFF
jgi:hypothetical protein